MIRRYIPLAALLLVAFHASLIIAAPDSCPASPGPELEVRAMSFNIRYGTANDGENHWERRRELVFETIRKHRPDVAGLQEALRFQIDEILCAVPGYGEVGRGRETGEKQGEYTVILYRTDRLRVDAQGTFWFSDTPDLPGSKSWGNRIPRICSWARFVEKDSGRAFYAFNLHIDHESQPSRERSAELVSRKIRERAHLDPALLLGDFNAGEENPAILTIRRELPLVDTFRALHPDAADAGTFHGFRGKAGKEKIDFIFAPAWAKVLEAEIVRDPKDGRFPSDHFPVLARVRFPATEEF